MDAEKKYLNQFILNLCEGNLAKANQDLRSVVVEKMQKRIKKTMDEGTKGSKDKAKKPGSKLPPWLNKAKTKKD